MNITDLTNDREVNLWELEADTDRVEDQLLHGIHVIMHHAVDPFTGLDVYTFDPLGAAYAYCMDADAFRTAILACEDDPLDRDTLRFEDVEAELAHAAWQADTLEAWN